ncbi:protocadherin Fat 4-like [Ylistrum balloti]|uniref:protocadherin Fat 4-like n=1 Tax=Ylistrum balloti TaxID=509963 RepID=UPI00290582B7|nr:protocadherin Fat 4-like [Ylistrum balloti]
MSTQERQDDTRDFFFSPLGSIDSGYSQQVSVDVTQSGTSSAVFFQRIAENVHPITFSQSSYEVDVPETHEDLFQVKGTKPPGLYLKERLDYEKNTIYNVTVEVILYDQTNTTEFIINVIDVDDMDPVFLNDSYSLHIMENDTDHVNTWLWTTPAIAAEDRDKGQGRQNLTFSISSGSNGNFQINCTTGQIRVTKVLFWKKDELNMYHLTIQATQDNDPNRYATSFLNVYVNDTNNHRPIFTNNPYKAVIDEHARVGSHVTQVHAEDGDEGPFAITSYKIIGSVRLFAIDSQTGIITVANSTGLDREAFPNITLEVQAIDVNANETGDTTFVEITLHDINDHTPNFTKGSYIFHVSSSDTAQVHANDDDIGRNGRVSYELFMEPSTPHVTINKDNGTITFINIREDLTFSVSACDNPIITSSR